MMSQRQHSSSDIAIVFWPVTLMDLILFVVLLQPYILVSLLGCRVCDFLAMAISALPRAKVYSTLVNKFL
jgi:hypothetical protein